MKSAYKFNFVLWRLIGGVVFFPYQLALGLSLRFWSYPNMLCVRLYVGPFKFWCGVRL